MSVQLRSAVAVFGMVVFSSAWLILVAPGGINTLVVAGAMIAALTVLSVCATAVPVPIASTVGPPASAQRRRRGAFLRQSNPDAPGRARPRAPGAQQNFC